MILDPRRIDRIKSKRIQLIDAMQALAEEHRRAPSTLLLQSMRDSQRELNKINHALGPDFSYTPTHSKG